MTRTAQTNSRDHLARQKVEELLRSGSVPKLETLLQRDEISLDELALDMLSHQIEIEVQSEQLRESNAALEAERRKFETIFHEMPVAAMLVELDNGAVAAENRQMRALFPKRFGDMKASHYLRHFGENRFDQDRISLGLADCRNGTGADVRSVSLTDGSPESYTMCDIRMARLNIGDDSSACVLTIIQPQERRL